VRADSEERAQHLTSDLEDEGRGGFGAWFRRRRSKAALRKEVKELRAEVKRLRRVEGAVVGAGGVAAKIVAGAELRDAFRAWVRVTRGAQRPRDLFTAEAADLGAAVVRRTIRVGLAGVVLAALPGALLIWQNLLLQSQVQQQASDTLIVRRAQLLETIYSEDCVEVEAGGEASVAGDSQNGDRDEENPTEPAAAPPDTEPELKCRPTAHIRARQEAVLAFIEIERGRGVTLDLRAANLSSVNLRGADAHRTNLSSADLSSADVHRADLSYAKLSYANLRSANLRGANLRDANLHGARLMNADLSGAYLYGAWLMNADLSSAALSETNLRHANLGDADLAYAELISADLRGAKLISADLIGAKLSSARLGGASLRGANLIGADLRDAKLRDADLGGADLHNACNLTPAQTESAIGSAATLLPEGLTHPSHWETQEGEESNSSSAKPTPDDEG